MGLLAAVNRGGVKEDLVHLGQAIA
jgi:hypothetical protein